MNEPTSVASDTADATEPERALVVRPPAALVPTAIAPAPSRLPARLARHLPALWNGGRGPLARAVVAGGLVAIGAVASRVATSGSLAVVPTNRGAAVRPAGPPRRITVTIDAEIGERTTRAWGRSTTRWGRRRVQIVQDFTD